VLVERIGDRAVDDAVVSQNLLRAADAGIDQDRAAELPGSSSSLVAGTAYPTA
jgi:hypothetical protein